MILDKEPMLGKIAFFLVAVTFAAIVVSKPAATSEPAASPEDKGKEDLTRIEYPSQAAIEWTPKFILPQDNLEKLFGPDWVHVARFNRVDRRHVYPGMTIKVPKNMEQARDYSPLPSLYEPAKRYEKYILISLTEQWLGAYEYGKLKFSMPAATGMDGHNTPTGLFQVDARDENHTSSLYKTEDQEAQYPMDNAIRFHVGEDNVSYWIHARDLPGKPASHGCVGVFDEAMQNRLYGIPANPVLLDSERLYKWAVGEYVYDEDDSGDVDDTGEEDGSVEVVCTGGPELLEGGPMVEITGDNPKYQKPLFPFLSRN